MAKLKMEFTKEEIETLVNKLADHESVKLALGVREGNERIDIISKLTDAMEATKDGK